jgi:hypothetical protein
MEYEAHEMAASLFNGQRNARFPMKQRKRRFDEQYQLAGAGGFEPPHGGIKICLIIQ